MISTRPTGSARVSDGARPVLGRSKVKVEDLVALWRNGERLVTIADE